MRSLRWLLLVAKIGIAVAVGVIYRASFFRARANRRATPAALGLDMAGNVL